MKLGGSQPWFKSSSAEQYWRIRLTSLNLNLHHKSNHIWSIRLWGRVKCSTGCTALTPLVTALSPVSMLGSLLPWTCPLWSRSLQCWDFRSGPFFFRLFLSPMPGSYKLRRIRSYNWDQQGLAMPRMPRGGGRGLLVTQSEHSLDTSVRGQASRQETK